MTCQQYTLPGFPEVTLTHIAVNPTEELVLAPRTAVLVVPGGGYSFTSDREADPIAASFVAAGYAAFILRYTVREGATGDKPLLEGFEAIRFIREHAAELNVDPERIFACGFSAGGHLAASLGTLYARPSVRAHFGENVDPLSLLPNGLILAYPVITSGDKAHKGSFRMLCGSPEATDGEMAQYSLENFVTPATPPTFLWHTAADKTVPVENSLCFAEALSACHVPFELHVFPRGQHGLSRADELTAKGKEGLIVPYVARWMSLAIEFINNFGKW